LSNVELKEKLTDALCLLGVPGVGRGRYLGLVNVFGSAAAALEAPLGALKAVPKLGSETATAIKDKADVSRARQTAARIVQLGWTPLLYGEDDYPAQLKNIPGPPPILYRLGRELSSDERLVSIVGTRHPTEGGRQFTRGLASQLAEGGITVVSGMAEGIDSEAHRGALDGGGLTVAIWGSSLDIVYPPSNRDLARRIQAGGATYSEYPPGTQPDRAFFPERNRIISGLSAATVVVEAGRKSGALITAELALEQGRDLFAVPGPPTSPMSIGTNALIKQGAQLLTSPEDIFEQLPLKQGIDPGRSGRLPEMTAIEKDIVGHLGAEPIQIDQLSRATHIAVTELMEYLLALEMKGVVKELSGKRYARVSNIA
jgi:DNA processing protein